MTDDRQLLLRYVSEHSEAAFGELVSRYVNLVYSAALRRVSGDAHLAEDISQLVFADLARKARSLPENVVLAGWLHRATSYAAAQLIRTNRRRRRREEEAITMNALESQAAIDWDSLQPLLDEALDRLQQNDRDALVLRFFEQHSLADVGRSLGVNEDAARKRVHRALDKLRAHLRHKGLTTTAAILSAAISVNAVQIAPASLAATLTGLSLAHAGTAAGTASTILKLMSMTKLQLGIGASVLAIVTASLIFEHQSGIALRKENATLRQQITQLNSDNEALSRSIAATKATVLHLPAPPMHTASEAADSAPDTLQSTNLYNRLKDKDLKLTAQQLESYLTANARSAASLLAAYRTAKDPALLTEAMRNFPNDPQVAFEAALRKDASPEDRRHWLDALKQSDPDNALGYYLSALDYFKASQPDQGIKEFTAASNKSFQDYTSERYQDDAEAYMAAGYSVADAKAASGLQLLLPQLQQVKDLGLDMIQLSKSYQQAGDSASAQAALQMAIDLGSRYSTPSPGEPAISQLVGQTLEIIALKSMDPNSPYGSDGQTVQDRINQVLLQKTALQDRSSKVESIVPTMPEQDWISYRDRWLMFGEQNAEEWLINKYGKN
jgi:RNA polymerase sigma factor (sigma-70 family)